MQRFGMYRWHIMDPVRFDKDLRITIRISGWRQGGRYLAQNQISHQFATGTRVSLMQNSLQYRDGGNWRFINQYPL